MEDDLAGACMLNQVSLWSRGGLVTLDRTTGALSPGGNESELRGYLSAFPKNRVISYFCCAGRSNGLLQWDRSAVLRIDDEEFDLFDASLVMRFRQFSCIRFLKMRNSRTFVEFNYFVSQAHLWADPLAQDMEDVLIMAYDKHKRIAKARTGP